jgi:hypothetical protein
MEPQVTTSTILSKSFQTLKQNFIFFLLLAILFLFVTGFLFFFSYEILLKSNFFTILLFALIALVIYSRFAVMIHRAALLGEKELIRFFSWSNHDTKFYLIALGLAVSFLVTVMIISFLLTLLVTVKNQGLFSLLLFAIMVFIGYVFSRISLVFPAAALGQKLTIEEAWAKSSNYKSLLFVLIILVPYLLNLVLDLLQIESVLFNFVFAVIATVVTIFEVVILSHAYNDIVNADSEFIESEQ